MRGRLVVPLLAALAALALDACAGQECDFHSQCGVGRYCSFGRCRQDCLRDVDCDAGQQCNEVGQCVAGGLDAGTTPMTDAGPTPMTDAGTTPMTDAGTTPTTDAGPPGLDAGSDAGPPVGTGRYLDRCTAPSGCASGLCVEDVGGTRMCSVSCTSHRECASEHVCAGGACRHDDTGTACTTGAAAACALGLCLGNSATGRGHCTRECADARDCPAGFACAAAGAARVCVEIEKPCADANACETGLCLSLQGCTAECRTAADCPRRFGFLPAYRCERAFGSTNPICVPPDDVLGADAAGASCPATGANTCRSGACNAAAPTGPMCTQSCTEGGGCGPGLGCFPEVDGSAIELLCARAGTRALGGACGSGRECDSGLCDTGGYCTRLCTLDGLCPSDMTCAPVAGFGISLCRR
ncbi:MAG: hypothetical protein KF729_31510 [Sandaracinaceae bacterium]|nr:hypothetical protein [Sandaracinaceae bacterium]